MRAILESKSVQFIGAALYIIAVFLISFYVTQDDFVCLLTFYTIAFAGWLVMLKHQDNPSWLIWIALLVHIPMIFAFPKLSDDVYRFYWDGRLWWEGISPYGVLPREVLNRNIPSLDIGLFEKLNSPDYFTVYPPGSQLYFAISAFRPDVTFFSISLKILFLLTLYMGLYFLNKIAGKYFKLSFAPVLFLLNPLVILEGIGNLHFEIVMLSFLAGAIWYFMDQMWLRASLFFIAACAIKLLPLMLLPFFFFRFQKKVKALSVIISLGILALFIWLMTSTPQLQSFFNSLDLYFRKFEFNASIYFILREIGNWLSGYNLISILGPLLAISTVILNVIYAYKLRKEDMVTAFFKYALIVWAVYLFLSTTVHPWYIMPLVLFSMFTKYRFAIAWSFTVVLSYAFYHDDFSKIFPYLIAAEYGIIGLLAGKNASVLTR